MTTLMCDYQENYQDWSVYPAAASIGGASGGQQWSTDVQQQIWYHQQELKKLSLLYGNSDGARTTAEPTTQSSEYFRSP